jgi:uncharacterized membrane protein YebE (DUF533 family)
MINPEKLLGGLVGMGLGKKKGLTRSLGKGIGFGTKAAVGMGVLGVAMAAFEHYSQQQGQAQARASTMPGSVPPAASYTPVPPPASSGAMPPPPPGSKTNAASPQNVTLLIQAMIASANADGVLDSDERVKIFEKLKVVGLSDEERTFLTHELLNPPSMEAIARQVTNRELAQQVYAVSLLAIELDTEAEQNYMRDLAARLSLEQETIQMIHNELGIEKLP